jgi:membrane associated rhomboid family serine protease/tetratricopeptide (TPR) repeat protein
VTLALTVLNVIVFAVAEAHGSTHTADTLLRFGALSRTNVWNGEWWRLLTYSFLHVGTMHLFVNTWFGFRLCVAMEHELGHVEFLLLYVLSGLAGGAASVLGHDAVTAGASGALFGLIGARYARWWVQTGSLRELFKHPRFRQDLIIVLLWFVLGAYVGFDNWAHGGGLVFGTVFALALAKGQGSWWPVPLSVLLVIGLAVAATRPLPVLHDRTVSQRAALAAYQRGDYPKVVALTEGTKDPLLLDLRSVALIALRRFDDAELAANTLVAGSPKEPGAWELRGRVRDLRGDLTGARDDFDHALKLDGDFSPALIERAEVEWRLGDRTAAMKDAELAAQQGPDDPHAQFALIELTRAGGAAKHALELCEHALNKLPSDIDLKVQRARLLSDLGRYEDAAHAMDELADKEPKSESVHAWRCYVLAAAGREDDARLSCDEAIDLDESADEARLIRGWLSLQSGELEGADEDFAFALAARKTSGALAGRGFVELKREHWKEAKAAAEAALSYDAADTKALLLSAEIALHEGDLAKAKERFDQAKGMAPPSWYEGRIASAGLLKL